MKGMTFLEALGDIEEKDLARAESHFYDSNAKIITSKVFKILGAAATVVFIIGFAIFMRYIADHSTDPVKPAESTDVPYVSETETETEPPETAETVYEPSEGLRYKKDGGTYVVTGLGTCRDKDIVIPDTHEGIRVTAIDGSAFEGKSIKSVVIPSAVTVIMNKAFKDCAELETVVMIQSPADGLQRIGDSAFYGCGSLKEIVLPDTVTDIGSYVFENCSSLTSFKMPAVFENMPGSSLLRGCSSLETVELSDGLKRLTPYFFAGCTSLKTVKLPESLENIEYGVFMDCTSLCEITVPANVTSIDSDVFKGCVSLCEIVIPDKVSDLGTGVFSGCTALSGVRLGNRIDTVGDELFKDCVSLKEITLPESVREIVMNAFIGSSLTALELPSKISLIEGSLYGCPTLKTLTVSEKNSKYYSEGNCIIKKSGKELVLGCAGSVIPEGVKSISADAFYGCTGLQTVVIPDTVKKLGGFTACTDLVSVIIPESVTEIGESAFSGCTSLLEISVPDSVKTDKTAGWFRDCTSLTKAYIGSGVTYADSIFEGCVSLKEITFGALIKGFYYTSFNDCVSLETINFPGTKEQWLGILPLDSTWDLNTGDYIVKCTDGTVDKHDFGLSGDKWVARAGHVKAVRKKNGKIGLYDGSGRAITDFIYDDAQYIEGMLLLARQGKYFLFNPEDVSHGEYSGTMFKELKSGFDKITIFKINSGMYFAVEANGKSYFATKEKIYLDTDCTYIEYAGIRRFILRSSSGKYGLYGYTGYAFDLVFTEIYPQTADEIRYYDRSERGTVEMYNRNMMFVKENGKYAVFGDRSGRAIKISDFIYDHAGVDGDGKVFAVRDGKTHYLDYFGNESDAPATEYVEVVLEIGGLRIVQKQDEMGIVDSDGNTVVPIEYLMVFAASEDRFFCVKVTGECVIFDGSGEVVADGFRAICELQAPDAKNSLYIVGISKNGKTVPILVDKDGERIDPGGTVLAISYGENDTYIINGKRVFDPND